MKRVGRFAFAVQCLLAASCVGCSSSHPTRPPDTNVAALPTPTREILVTDGDLNKAYDILGEVECTLTGKSVYSTTTSLSGEASPEATKEAKDMLRRVAYAKYGDSVDAIINAKTSGGYEGGFWGAVGGAYGAKTGTVNAHGIAVSFKKVDKVPATTPEKAMEPRKRQ